jgi:hypothetical protein
MTPGSSVLFCSWVDEVLTAGPFEKDVISFVFGSLESRECSQHLNFKIRISKTCLISNKIKNKNRLGQLKLG